MCFCLFQLAACTDFRERRNIREALRELKGLKLDSDKIVTYSFDTDSVNKLSSLRKNLRTNLRNPKSDRSSLTPADTVNRNEINNNTKVDSIKNGYVTSPVEERTDSSSCLYVGSVNAEQNDIEIQQSKLLTNGHCVGCEANSSVPNKELRNNSDIKDVSKKPNSCTRPVSLKLNSTEDASTVVRFANHPRHVKRTYSSPFSPTFLLSPVSKTVSRLKHEQQTKFRESQREVPNGSEVKPDNGNIEKLKIESVRIMKTPDSRRNYSESSVPVTRNELSWTDEVKKERSKSCNNENDYDIDGVKIRKKPNLSRKNRVEADWNMSPRLGTKFRKKLGSSSDSVETTTVLGSSTDSVVNAVNTSDKSSVVKAADTGKVEESGKVDSRGKSKVTRAESAKRPPIRRKLPEIPVPVSKQEDDSDENVHEKTLRLLQERRQKRRDKLKKEIESDTNTEYSPSSKGSVEERPRSKKKEIRLRRELQLLNRASESIISKTESHLRKSEHSDSDGDEKEKPKLKSSRPLGRSKSDMVRSKPPITPESAARKVEEKNDEAVVEVDLESFDAMPTENKIDLIGNLMQEEAKLQEMVSLVGCIKN